MSESESDNSEVSFSKGRTTFSSSEEEEEIIGDWSDPIGNQPKIAPFASPSGFILEDLNLSSDVEVERCYEVFVPDSLFDEIAEQTNLYAAQQLENGSSDRLKKWTVTNRNEIKRFFGLILWMGLVKLPAVHLYWSNDPAYMQTFPKNIMSRNRFEILLRMLHFTDNKSNNESNLLIKIQPLIDALETNFKKYYNPTEAVCIEDSLIPLRGRIILRQHLKEKRHKYEIKLYKLCCESGYTYALRVYAGNSLEQENGTATKVIMSLCKDLFDKGHTLYTDNKYTSLKLAEKLVSKNVHLVGTLRSNRRGNPLQVISKNLKRGEAIAQENGRGITILKWKDKQDVLVLSTKHSSEMVNVYSRSGCKLKPIIIMDYNSGKAAVHLSNQMNVYDSPPRPLKWYRKLAVELLLNTAVLNSFILYKNITKKNISITEFRKKLAVSLTNCREIDVPTSTITTSKKQHKLQSKPGRVSAVRKYCKSCYEANAAQCGRKKARNLTKQVVTFCDSCKGQPFLCLPCFNKIH